MKNQVLLVIFLFFGFAFLVYLFPVIFVEAAKLESGVTITAPATTETEKICNDQMDNDNDGKIDAADQDCAAAPAGTGRICGLQIVSGVPINYGQLNPGHESNEQIVRIKNEGPSYVVARIMIKGGNWISDAAGNATIYGPEITHVSVGPDGTYWSKKALSSNEIQIPGEGFGINFGQTLPLYFQVMVPVSGVSGSLHQEVTIDLLCN